MQGYIEQTRAAKPHIHCITNAVTINDCANILLACGGSPIMANAKEEVQEITALCDGLSLNLGMPSGEGVEAMLLAGQRANALGHPVVLDPVGVGASRFRTGCARRLLEMLRFTVIRGNLSEIKALAGSGAETHGVDAHAADAVTEDTLDSAAAFARTCAKETGAVIVITGAMDIVSDGGKTYVIQNGHPMMSSVTGTGCMLSTVIAAFVTANPEKVLEATAAAVCAMGLAGEIAHTRLGPMDGNATYRNYIIDAMYNMTSAQLQNGAKYELRYE